MRRFTPSFSMVMLFLFAMGASAGANTPFDKFPLQTPNRSSLEGTDIPLTGSNSLFHATGKENLEQSLDSSRLASRPGFAARQETPPRKPSPFSQPSMMLLVGCGLVGLAGIGRRMFQGRRMFRK